MPEIRLNAPLAAVRADSARRTITGLVVPWDRFATVSTGQTVAFARGSIVGGDRSKLVLDHDPNQPVAVYASATDTESGLEATYRVPEGAAGDQVLAMASSGLRDGLSAGVDVQAADDRPQGLYVTQARLRHVALLSEPAFDDARVMSVTAAAPTINPTGGSPTMPEPATTAPPAPPGSPQNVTAGANSATVVEAPSGALGGSGVIPTAAAAAPAPFEAAPARVRDAYPYAVPHLFGGPSFVMDAYKSLEDPGSIEADRWRRSLVMLSDPTVIQAGMHRFAGAARMVGPAAEIAAAPGTTTTDPALVPDRWLPERYVPLRGAKAPVYTAIAKYPTADFTTLQVPRTVSETGLSGKPADEITPIAPGTIATDSDNISIEEVEGSYTFSRKLLLGSNPQIDQIALDAMDRAWLADVETRAVAFFTTPANSTAVAATYADGPEYVAVLRGRMAALAAATLYQATAVIPPSKEYIAVAEADDGAGRPLLPYGPQINAPGTSSAGYATQSVQGVPLFPGPYQPANKTLMLDQSLDAAVCFATPVMNFRLEWTTDTATGGNVKVLKLVKYSGVGFWTQYLGGVLVLTNSTPIAALGAGVDEAPAKGRK